MHKHSVYLWVAFYNEMGLLYQRDLAVEFAEPAFHHLSNDLFRLAAVLRLLSLLATRTVIKHSLACYIAVLRMAYTFTSELITLEAVVSHMSLDL